MNDAIIATANTHLQELLKELPSALQKTISTFAEEQQRVIMRQFEEWKCLVIHDYEKSSFEETDFQTAIPFSVFKATIRNVDDLISCYMHIFGHRLFRNTWLSYFQENNIDIENSQLSFIEDMYIQRMFFIVNKQWYLNYLKVIDAFEKVYPSPFGNYKVMRSLLTDDPSIELDGRLFVVHQILWNNTPSFAMVDDYLDCWRVIVNEPEIKQLVSDFDALVLPE